NGSRLLARVDADRRLVVSSEPAGQDWLFCLNGAGELRTRSGRVAMSLDQPAGQRVLLVNGWETQPVIIEELEWTPEHGLAVRW
ncbi:MAG: hypothetical protein ACYC7M_12930, partial [Bellilinea sp.]